MTLQHRVRRMETVSTPRRNLILFLSEFWVDTDLRDVWRWLIDHPDEPYESTTTAQSELKDTRPMAERVADFEKRLGSSAEVFIDEYNAYLTCENLADMKEQIARWPDNTG